MEIDFIKILVVSHEKLVNTFKPCLFIAWHYQEGQLIHVVGRGGGGGCSNTGSDILYIKKLLKVWNVAGMKNLTALHNTGSSLGRNLCSSGI